MGAGVGVAVGAGVGVGVGRRRWRGRQRGQRRGGGRRRGRYRGLRYRRGQQRGPPRGARRARGLRRVRVDNLLRIPVPPHQHRRRRHIRPHLISRIVAARTHPRQPHPLVRPHAFPGRNRHHRPAAGRVPRRHRQRAVGRQRVVVVRRRGRRHRRRRHRHRHHPLRRMVQLRRDRADIAQQNAGRRRHQPHQNDGLIVNDAHGGVRVDRGDGLGSIVRRRRRYLHILVLRLRFVIHADNPYPSSYHPRCSRRWPE